jgi:hypothetical protein
VIGRQASLFGLDARPRRDCSPEGSAIGSRLFDRDGPIVVDATTRAGSSGSRQEHSRATARLHGPPWPSQQVHATVACVAQLDDPVWPGPPSTRATAGPDVNSRNGKIPARLRVMSRTRAIARPVTNGGIRPKIDKTHGTGAGNPAPGAAYCRMSASTSSRRRSMISGVVPSRLSRSRGSVFDGRTLKCQSSNSTDTPSSV